jgi:hypothetical protein
MNGSSVNVTFYIHVHFVTTVRCQSKVCNVQILSQFMLIMVNLCYQLQKFKDINIKLIDIYIFPFKKRLKLCFQVYNILPHSLFYLLAMSIKLKVGTIAVFPPLMTGICKCSQDKHVTSCFTKLSPEFHYIT